MVTGEPRGCKGLNPEAKGTWAWRGVFSLVSRDASKCCGVGGGGVSLLSQEGMFLSWTSTLSLPEGGGVQGRARPGLPTYGDTHISPVRELAGQYQLRLSSGGPVSVSRAFPISLCRTLLLSSGITGECHPVVANHSEGS